MDEERQGISSGPSEGLKKAQRLWRPVGFWALTFHVAILPVAMFAAVLIRPDFPIGSFVGLYGTLLGAWCVAAGIRHVDKKFESQLDNQPRKFPRNRTGEHHEMAR